MSDKGEKTCPLCTEEMDLTDQQLKPCNCNYQICVWCWHHIMEMAEKDETEGLCPACRTPYDKEKVMAMAANCERLMAKINYERKQKLQKTKSRVSDGRMHLTNFRVIKRNLVYIMGLPLTLADEDLLQRKEYFGRYGKVLKVSISRTASGAIQHASNNSCCVYITYSKEEEAARCIQSVHSFVLEGRSLRASFGTTKYCHAWLRNMPCTIPDCLYLHDFGSQEDSFSKDEIVSAFSRSRVQQIIGATNNMHRSPGNTLPSPTDISSVTKHVAKSTTQNTGSQSKRSCVDGGTGRSSGLPAATSWVMRVSGSLPPATNSCNSDGLTGSKSKTLNGAKVVTSDASGFKVLKHDVRRPLVEESCESNSESLGMVKDYIDGDGKVDVLNPTTEVLDKVSVSLVSGHSIPSQSESYSTSRGIDVPPLRTSSLSHSDNDRSSRNGGNLEIASGLSSSSLCSTLLFVPNSSVSNDVLVNLPGSQCLRQTMSEQVSTPMSSVCTKSVSNKNFHGYDEDLYHPSRSMPSSCFPQNFNLSSHSRKEGDFVDQTDIEGSPANAFVKHQEAPSLLAYQASSTGLADESVSEFVDQRCKLDHSTVLSERGTWKSSGIFNNNTCIENNVASDMRENSIISKILSIDMDPWEDSLILPQGLIKLLGESNEQHGPLNIRSLWKVRHSNQSRFSFARQDDFLNQAMKQKHIFQGTMPDANRSSAFRDLIANRDSCMGKNQDIFSSTSSLESDNLFASHPFTSSKLSVSKIPTSPPPGFSVPSRAPPPGFSSHESMLKGYESNVSHLLQSAAPQRKMGVSSEAVEFFDPAILEVGEGLMPGGLNNQGFLAPGVGAEYDAKLQQLRGPSLFGVENPGLTGGSRNMFLSSNDMYSTPPPSGYVESKCEEYINIPISNWGSWNDAKCISDQGLSEIVTNEELSFNKYAPYDGIKYQMHGSSNLYNKRFAL